MRMMTENKTGDKIEPSLEGKNWKSKNSRMSVIYSKAFYTLHTLNNPIKSLQITLCGMDLM